jgi:zinc protease
MAVVSLRSLSDERLLNSALEVTADLIHRPYFPESAFERERNRQLIGIQAQKQSPSTIASKKFFRMMYGSHPYAEPSGGTEQSVKSIKRNNLKSFHARYYVGNNALVAIVGAVDRGRAKEIAEQVVGALPAGEAAAEIAAPITAQAGEEEYIEYPSVQSHILLGHPVVKRGDIDYFDLYVGNHILGGSGLVSKISEEVRENRGLAYSAYSYFSPMRRAGPFQAGLQTKNESRDEALEVLRKTIADFIEHGPALDDLENSKKNITGGFPLRIDSNKKIVSYLGVIGFYGLPDSYLDDFNRKINAVSAASIKDAFKRRVRPAEMVTVIVGGEVKKKSAIEEKDVH